MVTVVRKTRHSLTENRRAALHAVSWQIRTNIWNPPTDIFETEDFYVVRMEVAGMRDGNVEVAVEDNVLYISGNRPDFPERRAFHQMEIRFGKFFTAVSLPGPVELEETRAEYEDGFLTIKLPKINLK